MDKQSIVVLLAVGIFTFALLQGLHWLQLDTFITGACAEVTHTLTERDECLEGLAQSLPLIENRRARTNNLRFCREKADTLEELYSCLDS